MDDSSIRMLAENYLDTHSHLPFDPALKYAIVEEIEKWEENRKTISEDDPLYEASEKAYEENKRRWLQILGEKSDKQGQFLETVAEHFVSEGVWLEQSVIRAVNLVLGQECRTWLVVGGVRLEEGAEVTNEQKLQTSVTVRKRAKRSIEEVIE